MRVRREQPSSRPADAGFHNRSTKRVVQLVNQGAGLFIAYADYPTGAGNRPYSFDRRKTSLRCRGQSHPPDSSGRLLSSIYAQKPPVPFREEFRTPLGVRKSPIPNGPLSGSNTEAVIPRPGVLGCFSEMGVKPSPQYYSTLASFVVRRLVAPQSYVRDIRR